MIYSFSDLLPPGTTEKDISPKEECDHKDWNGVSALEPIQGGFVCMICDTVIVDEIQEQGDY